MASWIKYLVNKDWRGKIGGTGTTLLEARSRYTAQNEAGTVGMMTHAALTFVAYHIAVVAAADTVGVYQNGGLRLYQPFF